MSFSAVVSEICLLNGEEEAEELEICSFQINSSPSHIKYCMVLQVKPCRATLWPHLHIDQVRTQQTTN